MGSQDAHAPTASSKPVQSTPGGPPLTRLQVAGYAGGNFGKNILANTLAYFLVFYATDILAIRASTAGLIALSAALLAAALDPVIGVLADRTRSRWGKYGHFILFGAPFASFFLVMIFLVPAKSPFPALSLFAFLILFKISYGLMDLPHNALMGRITVGSRERSFTATLRFLFSSLGSLSIALGAFAIFAGDAGAQANRFLAFAAIAGILSLAAMWISWLSVAGKDRALPIRVETVRRQFAGIRQAVGDRDGFAILMVCLLSGATFPVFAGSLAYFAKYNLEDEGLIPVGIIAMIAGQIVSVPFWMRLSMIFEKSWALMAAHGLAIIALVTLFIDLTWHRTALVVLIFLVGAAGGGIWSIIWAMVPDVTDKLEASTGIRSEAVMFSMSSLSMKVGLSASAGLLGLFLYLSGFEAGVSQDAGTLLGIKAIMCLIPAAGSAAIILCLLPYRLTHEAHQAFIVGRG